MIVLRYYPRLLQVHLPNYRIRNLLVDVATSTKMPPTCDFAEVTDASTRSRGWLVQEGKPTAGMVTRMVPALHTEKDRALLGVIHPYGKSNIRSEFSG